MWKDSTITVEDVRDQWQKVRWWEPALGVILVIAIRFSQSQLASGGQSLSTRIALLLLPVPAVALGLWAAIRRHRLNNELEREITRTGAAIALVVTFVTLIVLGQIDVAFGAGASRFRYQDLWMIPIVAHFVASVLYMRRYTRR